MTYVPPTPKMISYLESLLSERRYPELGHDADERLGNLTRELESKTLDKFKAMNLIDYLKVAPLDTESGLPVGVYQHNGEIFVVKFNRGKTNKYTSKLVELMGSARRLNEPGEHVPIEFVYAPGMLAKLRPEDQMTLEAAKPFILRYGRCLFCGQGLRAAKSVERLVGPVCFKRYASNETEPEPTLDPVVAAELTGLLAQLQELS